MPLNPLPATADLVNTGITKGTFKTALSGMRAFLNSLLGSTGSQADALTALGALLNGSVPVSAAGTTVGATHRGKLFDCTGTGGWTLAVDACATLGAGFHFAVRNSTSGTVTINPNLSENIDDASTLDLAPGETCLVQVNADATGLKTVGRTVSANGAFRSAQTFTASGTWNKPANLKRVKVRVLGAGGGAEASLSDGLGGWTYGEGGYGGGYAESIIEAASLGASESVTVGAGGAGGASAGLTGAAGGTSSFGTHCSATGGAGGGTTDTPGSGSGGQINYKGHLASGPVGGGSAVSGGNAVAVAGSANTGSGGGSRSGAQSGMSGGSGLVVIEEFF